MVNKNSLSRRTKFCIYCICGRWLGKRIINNYIFILLFVFVIAIWCIYAYLAIGVEIVNPSDSVSSPTFIIQRSISGEFGDAFGALNTLFTGLAFIGLLISIRLQSIELKETRKEIKIQAEELKKQTINFKKQNDIIMRQSLDQTFYSMIDLLSKTKSSISLTLPGIRTYEGMEAIVFLEQNLEKRLIRHTDIEMSKERFDELYQSVDYVKIMGHYFQSIYRIVKSIDEHDTLDEKEKKFYISILRALFSQNELKALFYNGISSFGRNKFKPLLEKYNMLEHIFFVNYKITEEMIDSLIRNYKIEAFGSNEKIKERYSKASLP